MLGVNEKNCHDRASEYDMRLTCPNCDAQYEVPDGIIPETGRDVQCSNCGQTWFQHHPDHSPSEQPPAAAKRPQADAPPAPPPPPPAPKEPERKQLNPEVTDILRQEAAAEQEARRQRQSQTLESQPDLGLDNADDAADTEKRARQARERLARMREHETEETSDGHSTAARGASAAISSRRDLLPDIEEINSTLRTGDAGSGKSSATRAPADDAPAGRNRGFRTGFFLMLLLFAVLALIYVYAPQIAQAVPQADPFLSGYVGWVDGLRQWLDLRVQGALQWLDNMASQSTA